MNAAQPAAGEVSDKKVDVDTLDPVLETNDENIPNESDISDRSQGDSFVVGISPKIFGLKEILEPMTIETLDNAIYELGVVNLCWPDIIEPVFETRTCFPKSYYTNITKERLLLAYAENFRRQFHFHYKSRKPLFLQAPNECGLQKMVCTSIRPTKLCFADTNTWQGLASLVADYFDYDPLLKPMLQVAIISRQYYVSESRGVSLCNLGIFSQACARVAYDNGLSLGSHDSRASQSRLFKICNTNIKQKGSYYY